MPTPDFVLGLRTHIGHDPLWLSTAAGVVLNKAGELLLHRRADTGTWGLPGGIIEPGEEPADAAVREIFEETSVVAVPECLAAVTVSGLITYPNGDQVRYLELLFRCRAAGGAAQVNDSESVEVGWHAVDDLPGLHERVLGRIRLGLASLGGAAAESGGTATAYAFSGVSEVIGRLPA